MISLNLWLRTTLAFPRWLKRVVPFLNLFSGCVKDNNNSTLKYIFNKREDENGKNHVASVLVFRDDFQDCFCVAYTRNVLWAWFALPFSFSLLFSFRRPQIPNTSVMKGEASKIGNYVSGPLVNVFPPFSPGFLCVMKIFGNRKWNHACRVFFSILFSNLL